MEDQGMEPMEPIPCLDLNDGYLTPQREEPELEPQQNDLGLTFGSERHFVTPDSPTHNTQETVETGVDHDFNRPPYPVEFSLVGCDINDPPENVSELGDMDVDKVEENEFDEVEENEFDEVDIDDEHPVDSRIEKGNKQCVDFLIDLFKYNGREQFNQMFPRDNRPLCSQRNLDDRD